MANTGGGVGGGVFCHMSYRACVLCHIECVRCVERGRGRFCQIQGVHFLLKTVCVLLNRGHVFYCIEDVLYLM